MNCRSINLRRLPLSKVAFFQEGPGLRTYQWTMEGMKVINVKNILGDGSIAISNTDKFISQHEFEAHYSHFAVEENDIVIASSGNTYGKVGRIRSEHLPLMMNTSVVRFHSQDKAVLDDDFLYAWLRSSEFKNQVEGFVTGGAQPNFGPTHLKQMNISLPDIHQQKAISSILLAYDDLIENNRRRIRLLEQSTRLLYKEWCVHLHFPGHEHVKVVDGVPKGWEKKMAFDVMEILSGGTPKTVIADYWDGNIPFYTPKDSTDTAYVSETEKTITDVGLKNCSSALYPKDTVFITARGTVGSLNLAQVPMAINQSCYALVAKEPLTQYFLYYSLLADMEQLRSRASGAVFDAVIRDTFKLVPFLVPKESLIRDFTDEATPILDQISNLLSQNRKLKQARDLLLPRLMSGEINV